MRRHEPCPFHCDDPNPLNAPPKRRSRPSCQVLTISVHAAATCPFSPCPPKTTTHSPSKALPIRSDMPCPTRVPPTATTRARVVPILPSHHSDEPSRVLPSHSDKPVRDQVVTSPTTVTCDSRSCRFATSRAAVTCRFSLLQAQSYRRALSIRSRPKRPAISEPHPFAVRPRRHAQARPAEPKRHAVSRLADPEPIPSDLPIPSGPERHAEPASPQCDDPIQLRPFSWRTQ